MCSQSTKPHLEVKGKNEAYFSLTFQFAVESWSLECEKHHINDTTGPRSAENLLRVAVLAAQPIETYICRSICGLNVNTSRGF